MLGIIFFIHMGLLRSPEPSVRTPGGCHELAFFTFFLPYFSQYLRSLSVQILSYQSYHTRFIPLSPAHSVHRNKTTRVLNQDVADITFTLQQATRFEANQNTSSIVGGLSPRQDHRRRHSLQDWRIHPVAHQGTN